MDISKFRTVDWVKDADAQNKATLARPKRVFTREHFSMASRSWLVLAGSGAIIGVIAVVLTITTGLLADLREGHCRTSWYLSESACCLGQDEGCTAWAPHHWTIAYVLYVALSVLFAVTASFMVSTLAPLAAGSGISEIKCIVQGFTAPQFLGSLVLLLKSVALPLTISSGLSVGKEGPSVHYAACVGHLFASRMLKQDGRKRSDLLVACCAAGVAVAFGSPLGGLLFGIEEMAAKLNMATIWRVYFCCLAATSVVAILNPFRSGKLVLFSVEYSGGWHGFELPFFLVLGVFGGVMGRLIIKYNLRVAALRKQFWAPHYLSEAAVLALLTAVVCYFNSYLRVDMTRSMQILFHECEHGGEAHPSCDPDGKLGLLFSLGFACVVRTLLLLITYGGAKVPAGIFVPSLAIGALFGRLVGTVVWMLYDKFPASAYFGACRVAATASTAVGGAINGTLSAAPSTALNNTIRTLPSVACVNPGAYALLGAGALLAGVMHITMTVVVVMFELTGAVHYIVPTMIVVGATRAVAAALGDGGIADLALRQNGYPFIEDEVPEAQRGATAADVMVPAMQTAYIRHGETLPREGQRFRVYPILKHGRLVGATSGSHTDRSPITVGPGEPVDAVNEIFRKLGPHTLFVIDTEGAYLGLITRKGFVVALHEAPQPFSALETRLGTGVAAGLQRVEALLGGLAARVTRRQ